MDEGGKPADEPQASRDQVPWPLSALDPSAAATRRRGLRFFHVVLLLLGGGSGLVVVGQWILVPVIIGVIAYVAMIQRGRYPDLVAGVDRLGAQLTELYASIEEANRQLENAPEGQATEPVAVDPPAAGIDPHPPAGDHDKLDSTSAE